MRDVSFGSYYPATSFVHKMDARIKILGIIAYIVAVFMVKSFHFLGFGACLLFVFVATAFSRVPFTRVLKSIKGILFLIILSAILQLFFNVNGKVREQMMEDLAVSRAGKLKERTVSGTENEEQSE